MAAAAAVPNDPFADAASVIACPGAPTGWTINPGENTGAAGVVTGGRSVLTPLTPIGEGGANGGNEVEVACDYLSKSTTGAHLKVLVRYALPRDPNPFSDFYIGCSANDFAAGRPNGAYAWNTKDRVHREVSLLRWSFAMFLDFYKDVAPGDVAPFKSIAHQMLKSSEPVAHECSGSGVETPIKSTWVFGFDLHVTGAGMLRTASTTGSFFTTPNVSGGAGTLTHLRASDIVVRLTPQGSKSTRSMRIHVGAPISFRSHYGSTLRAEVAVVSSNYAGCRTGNTGSLTISTGQSPPVALTICGRNLVQGEGAIHPRIDNV